MATKAPAPQSPTASRSAHDAIDDDPPSRRFRWLMTFYVAVCVVLTAIIGLLIVLIIRSLM